MMNNSHKNNVDYFTQTNSRFVGVLIMLCSLMFTSCNDNKQVSFNLSNNSVENILNFALTAKDNNTIELPFIYDSLTSEIPNDSAEKIILVQALKKRKFTIVDWGRGNYPPLGARIISVTMKRGNCFCQIDKIYYYTTSDSLYQMSERIRCSDSLTFFKKN